jgi:pimeloyl-ACP methyl ester carboxylesterase
MRDTGHSVLSAPRAGKPFQVRFDPTAVSDLRRRLSTRLSAPQASGPDWRTGPPQAYLQAFLAEWCDDYDFQAAEHRLNRFAQYLVPVSLADGTELTVHITLEPGSNPSLPPLVMTHGWPSLPCEFHAIVDRLAHPERHHGRADEGATVILLSLPGFGYSSTPRPVHAREIAEAWVRLLEGAFDCPRFHAHGGDWGAVVASWIAIDQPRRLHGLHLSMLGLRPALTPDQPLDEDEKRWVKVVQRRLAADGGYREQYATRPTTLAYGLADSPAFVAAWLLDKYHGWGGAGTGQAPIIPRERMLDLVSLYWFSGSLATAGWIYHADRTQRHELSPGQRCEVPTACAFFGGGFFPPPPTRWVERGHLLRMRRDFAEGGHFPALAVPGFLADTLAEWLRRPGLTSGAEA